MEVNASLQRHEAQSMLSIADVMLWEVHSDGAVVRWREYANPLLGTRRRLAELRAASEASARGEDAARRETAGHDTAGHDTAGHDTAGHEAAGHDAAGYDAAGERNRHFVRRQRQWLTVHNS